MRPRNLVFFDANYDSLYGAQRSMLTLAAGLAETGGVEVELVTSGDGALAAEARRRGLTGSVLEAGPRINVFGGAIRDYGPPRLARLAAETARYNLRAARRLRARGATHVVANDVRSQLLAGPGARLAGARSLWHVRDDGRLGPLHGVCGRIAHRIVTVSDGVRSVFTPAERARFAPKTTTVYTGLEPADPPAPERVAALRRELELAPGTPVVATIGMLTPRKGYGDVLDVAERLHGQLAADPLYLFVGDAPEGYEAHARDLRARAAALPPPLDRRVRFLGWRDDVDVILVASDLVVQPSRSEGLPRVLLEAHRRGTPSVSSDVSGASEVIVDGETGAIVPIGDVGALADAVRRLLTDEALRARLGSAAAERFRSRFSLERYLADFRAVLDAA